MLSVEQVTYETKISWQCKKAKAKRKSARHIKNLHILPGNSAEDLGSRREHWWGYISMYENTPKKLLRLPPKVFVTTLLSGSRKGTIGSWQSHSLSWCQGYILTLQALVYIEGKDQTGRSIWNYAIGTLTSWKRAERDCVIQLNCREVCTYVSYKTTRTWENFIKQGTEMILQLRLAYGDELWW